MITIETIVLLAYFTWSLVTRTNMYPILNRLDMLGALWAVFIALAQPNLNVVCTEQHMYPPWAILALLVVMQFSSVMKRTNTALLMYMIMYHIGD